MPGTWCTKGKREAVHKRDNSKCGYCGKRISRKHRTLDHIVPRSRGGNNNHHNLITACISCNQQKGTKTLAEYLEYLILEGVRSSRSVTHVRHRVMSMRFGAIERY
jgi:5-methylcytosine-specific restriction endonuclease McrA